jgi:hypothetical protein
MTAFAAATAIATTALLAGATHPHAHRAPPQKAVSVELRVPPPPPVLDVIPSIVQPAPAVQHELEPDQQMIRGKISIARPAGSPKSR